MDADFRAVSDAKSSASAGEMSAVSSPRRSFRPAERPDCPCDNGRAFGPWSAQKGIFVRNFCRWGPVHRDERAETRGEKRSLWRLAVPGALRAEPAIGARYPSIREYLMPAIEGQAPIFHCPTVPRALLEAQCCPMRPAISLNISQLCFAYPGGWLALLTLLILRSLFEGAVVFAPCGRRKDHVGKLRRLRLEIIVTDDKLGRLETAFHVPDVRFRIGQIFAEYVESLDLRFE